MKKNLAVFLMIGCLLSSLQSLAINITYHDGPYDSVEIVLGKNKKEVSKMITLIRRYYEQIPSSRLLGYIFGGTLGSLTGIVLTPREKNNLAIFLIPLCAYIGYKAVFSFFAALDKSIQIDSPLYYMGFGCKHDTLNRGVELSAQIQDLEKLGLLDNSENTQQCEHIYIRIIKNTGDQIRSLHGAYIDPAKSYGLVIDGYDKVQLTELKYNTTQF